MAFAPDAGRDVPERGECIVKYVPRRCGCGAGIGRGGGTSRGEKTESVQIVANEKRTQDKVGVSRAVSAS